MFERMKYLTMINNSFQSSTYDKILSRFLVGQKHIKFKKWIINTGVYTSKNPTKPQNIENEDSFTIGMSYICVADGVGGWISQGLSSAMYSRELVKNVEINLQELENYNKELNKDKFIKIINNSYERMKSSNIMGSSTLCVVYLDTNNQLHIFNLGDSKCIIYRKSDKEIIYESEIQQHNFNTPFQLGTGSFDTPDHAQYSIIKDVRTGDAIVVATDGLWDNLSIEKIIRMIEVNLSMEPRKIAEKLGKEALQLSLNSNYISPYSISLNNYVINRSIISSNSINSKMIKGGKPDDITVTIGIIQ